MNSFPEKVDELIKEGESLTDLNREFGVMTDEKLDRSKFTSWNVRCLALLEKIGGVYLDKFKEEENRGVEKEGQRRYHSTSIEIYYKVAILKGLKDAIESGDFLSGEPLINADSVPSFVFIREQRVKEILKRDFIEIQRCHQTECWKAVIVLCGSSLEGILFDVLKQKEPETQASPKSQKGKLEDWSLEKYIDVAQDIGLLVGGAQNLADFVREYRNAIHPYREIKSNLKIGKQEANIALNVLEMVIRDLEEKLCPSKQQQR